ncbi:hypothetical protein [Kitasatospora sp. NPDC088346]
MISTVDLFNNGVGPSGPHTVAPLLGLTGERPETVEETARGGLALARPRC